MCESVSDSVEVAEVLLRGTMQGSNKGGHGETACEICVLPDLTRRVQVANLQEWMDLCA
jgi:hypothetical protein